MAKELMEIGGFITSGAEIVNHDNSLSGNGTVDSPLGVVPGYNETVLWEGTLGAVGVTSATLSEAFTNFEQIEVWWAQQGERTLVQRYYTANLSQLFCLHGKYNSSNDQTYLFIAAWSISGTSAAKLYCKYKSSNQWNNNTWTDANELCPCKIVGINRKEV